MSHVGWCAVHHTTRCGDRTPRAVRVVPIASPDVCGRFVSSSTPEKIAEYFGAAFEGETLGENYNVAPTNDVYGVVAGPDGAPRLEIFHWGLIPVWAKERKVGAKMINARAETLATKPAYKGVFKKNRCLIPMDGFYEWKAGSPADRSPRRASRRSNRCSSPASTASRSRSPGCGRRGGTRPRDPTPTGCTVPRSSPRRRTGRCHRFTTACR